MDDVPCSFSATATTAGAAISSTTVRRTVQAMSCSAWPGLARNSIVRVMPPHWADVATQTQHGPSCRADMTRLGIGPYRAWTRPLCRASVELDRHDPFGHVYLHLS